jgi:LPS export ABC transporter permease LptF/LPS export ABC transporter permease LptG
MRSGGKLIERYVLAAVLPYLLLSLILLTAILFAQQSSRFAELLLATHLPFPLALEIALALIPNVLTFTLPMATLVGVLIGFSRLGGDSESVSMQAAGVSPWRVFKPVLILGVTIAALSFYNNFNLAPHAARSLRRTSLQVALRKLDSPVEPRSFNTNIPGKLIYVRDGDKALGLWGRVFIYWEDTAKGVIRLITARTGRIDSSTEQSELVLDDAVWIDISSVNSSGKSDLVTTHLAHLRLQIDTGRRGLLERLHKNQREADEMGWAELQAASKTDSSQSLSRSALILLHKKIAQSVTPLIFAMVGCVLGLRVRKGARGLGMLLSLIVMIIYYLLMLMGEQLARVGTVPIWFGMWLSVSIMLVWSGFWWWRHATGQHYAYNILQTLWGLRTHTRSDKEGNESLIESSISRRARLLNFPILMDIHILRSLSINFGFTLIALTSIFMIFTLFELWRFISTTGAAIHLVTEYLIYLTPLIIVQIAPASVLIAVLTTYSLLARRHETIAWWASGQSVYRIILPGVFFAILIGGFIWVVQEQVMPFANRRQDALRSQIRGNTLQTAMTAGRLWLASPDASGRFYSYTFDEKTKSLERPVIYVLDKEMVHLAAVHMAQSGYWARPDILELHNVESLLLPGGSATERSQRNKSSTLFLSNIEPPEAFKPTLNTPSQLSTSELSKYISGLARRGEDVRALSMALYAKFAEPFGAPVLALMGIPLALIFGRRNVLAALVVAVAVSLSFFAVEGSFRQLGGYGLLPVQIAAWSPFCIYVAIGGYLLSRSRT